MEERVSADSRLLVGRWTCGGARGAGSMGSMWQEWDEEPFGLLVCLGDPHCALWQAIQHTGVQFRKVLVVFYRHTHLESLVPKC